MAIIKIILRKDRNNGKGEHPLRLRITKNRQAKYLNLGIYLKPEHWDENKQQVKKGQGNSARLNAYISTKVAEAQKVSIELETLNTSVNSIVIKDRLIGKGSFDFLEYANRFVNSFYISNKIGSYKRAKTVIQKLKEYHGVNNKIYFETLTVAYLNAYEAYLKSQLKNTVNTVHANFRILRTIMNNAVREDIISTASNPFQKMKLKTEKTVRSYLTEDELLRMEQLSLPTDSIINDHRNIYVFASYSGGLRISDVLQLRWKNFDGERINIQIQKTKSQLSVKIPTKALEIIEKYKVKNATNDDFIFPLLNISRDEKDHLIIHQAISASTAYTNKNLKKICMLASIDKNISFHTSRHSFATIAITKGMRIEHVSKLLGHSAIRETQIYARILSAELDKAMEVFN